MYWRQLEGLLPDSAAYCADCAATCERRSPINLLVIGAGQLLDLMLN